MVIRKQLSSRDFKFKRIGIVGGMSLLKNITQYSSTNLPVLASPENPKDLEDDVVNQVGFIYNPTLLFQKYFQILFVLNYKVFRSTGKEELEN